MDVSATGISIEDAGGAGCRRPAAGGIAVQGWLWTTVADASFRIFTESYEGKDSTVFRWTNSHDMSGKSMAVIGTGASAVQIVWNYQLAALVKVFQRTPGWSHWRRISGIRAWARSPSA